jgi:hypothetical protein
MPHGLGYDLDEMFTLFCISFLVALTTGTVEAHDDA